MCDFCSGEGICRAPSLMTETGPLQPSGDCRQLQKASQHSSPTLPPPPHPPSVLCFLVFKGFLVRMMYCSRPINLYEVKLLQCSQFNIKSQFWCILCMQRKILSKSYYFQIVKVLYYIATLLITWAKSWIDLWSGLYTAISYVLYIYDIIIYIFIYIYIRTHTYIYTYIPIQGLLSLFT